MTCFDGEVEFEDRDACIKKGCWRKNNCCGLQMFLREHKATIMMPIEICKEVDF